jgi:hypothetical protein
VGGGDLEEEVFDGGARQHGQLVVPRAVLYLRVYADRALSGESDVQELLKSGYLHANTSTAATSLETGGNKRR